MQFFGLLTIIIAILAGISLTWVLPQKQLAFAPTVDGGSGDGDGGNGGGSSDGGSGGGGDGNDGGDGGGPNTDCPHGKCGGGGNCTSGGKHHHHHHSIHHQSHCTINNNTS